MKIIVVDTETSGLNPQNDQIIQLAAVDYDTGEEMFNRYFKFRGYMSSEAVKKHGLSQAYLNESGYLPRYNLMDFDKYISQWDDVILAGWNPGFDYQFINCAYDKENLLLPRMQYKTIDTFSLFITDNCDHNLSEVNLDYALSFYDLKREDKGHNALEDAILTRKLLQQLI